MQAQCSVVDIYSDSNWAGCRRTRKSSSGGVVMLGDHCIKSWSKTQAVVAKSSAEAELYGVVRGATEGLGILTLINDLGGEMRMQVHLDAAAAKGIFERRGLSKIRHIDVNVLWLQQTCARKEIPLKKVAGEENCSDLMTKHLTSAKIDKNLLKMKMSIMGGRAEKAAKLHMISNKCTSLDWIRARETARDKRGGDQWQSRGCNGVWHRIHTSPRISLFTPFKVAKGPKPCVSMHGTRFTRGIKQNGERFEFHDSWQREDRRHLILDEPWIGETVFVEEGRSLLEAQLTLDEAPGRQWKPDNWNCQ